MADGIAYFSIGTSVDFVGTAGSAASLGVVRGRPE